MDKFKVGDRVRIKWRQAGGSVPFGTIGIIARCDGDGMPKVLFGDYFEYFRDSQMELAPPVDFYAIRPGDSVTVSDGWQLNGVGKAGTFNVLEVDRDDDQQAALQLQCASPRWAKNTHVVAHIQAVVTPPVEAPVFPAGARVVLGADYPHTLDAKPGLCGVVIGCFNGDFREVAFDGWTNGHHGTAEDRTIKNRWNVEPCYLRTAPPLPAAPAAPAAKHSYIVIGDHGAASRPFKHPDRTTAEREAERLSAMKPGVKFTVYQAVAAVTMPLPAIQREVYA